MSTNGNRPLLLGLLGLACAIPAHAETLYSTADDWLLWPDAGRFAAYPLEPRTDPIRFDAYAGAVRDSNLFRLADDDPALALLGNDDTSDVVRRIGADVDGQLELSQQKLLFGANVARNSFQNFDDLDNTSYRGDIDWQWKLGGSWSGTLGGSREQALSDFAELQAPIRDLITEDHAHFTAAFQFLPSWRLRGGYQYAKYEHSNDLRTILDNDAQSAIVGIDYVSPAQTFVGLQYQATQGQYPNRQLVATSLVDNDYKEYESSLVFGWPFSGRTRFDARAGYTQRRYDDVPQRNFDGPTGRATLSYSLTPKTLIDLTGYREISSVEDLDASYVVAKGGKLGFAWAPSLKAVLQFEVKYEDRDLEGNPGFVLGLGPRRQDITKGARIGAGFRPWGGMFEMALGYEVGRRTSNVDLAEYDYNAAMANFNFRF
ncbi:MAG TPA: XrtB/PEP-CTERM-associated polysaccharide biosynthesis outer membrane protein EpsL [Steroidobacteraceae bacterium]|jgi:exopolysaccharide biosynthesis operon protein EpsL|nr:XrtB/PEP-CTERM-associated polysaccharide biosynthesis outer membrane protein EpsL [Steroidobacteraceae bacterium]